MKKFNLLRLCHKRKWLLKGKKLQEKVELKWKYGRKKLKWALPVETCRPLKQAWVFRNYRKVIITNPTRGRNGRMKEMEERKGVFTFFTLCLCTLSFITYFVDDRFFVMREEEIWNYAGRFFVVTVLGSVQIWNLS
jgi:hypothetical protein